MSSGKKASRVSAIPPRLLSVKQSAEYLGTTVWFVRTLVWSRAVPFVKLGKRQLFDRADLDRFVDQQKKGAA